MAKATLSMECDQWHINGCHQPHTITVAVIILTSIAILMLLLQCIFAQEPEFLTYENKDFGFSIQHPSDWKKEEENMSKSSNVNIAVSFVKQNGSQINSEADFYIRTEEFLGRNVTLEEFAQIQKAYASSLLAASSFNEIITIVGNRPAWQMEYNFKGIGGTIRHGLNILTINDDTGYSTVFTVYKKGYDRYFPIAQKMIHSFRLLGSE